MKRRLLRGGNKAKIDRRKFVRGMTAMSAALMLKPSLLYAQNKEKKEEKKEPKKEEKKEEEKEYKKGLDGPMLKAVKAGDYEIVEDLLIQGADPNATNQKNQTTALMIASRYGHIDIVKLLLDSGADVNAKNILGRTALMMSARNGKKDVVERLLIEENISVNAKDGPYKNTALMVAVMKYKVGPVKALLKHPKIRVNAKNEDGHTALYFAEYYEWEDLIKLLKEHGAK